MDVQTNGRSVDEPTDAAYGDDTAILLSSIAYCSLSGNVRSTMATYLPTWTVVWESQNADDHHYAFIASNGNLNVIAIRGSVLNFAYKTIEETIENWFAEDFNVFFQTYWAYPYDRNTRPMTSLGADLGLTALRNLKDADGKTMLDYVSHNIKEGKSLWITGHSLGGSLAPVYALYLHYMLEQTHASIPDFSVITFAGATVGNQGFADQYNATFAGKSRRYANTLDIVPFMADNVAGIAHLYNSPDAPNAADIEVTFEFIHTTLAKVFEKVAGDIENWEKWYNSKYTPLHDVISLEGKTFPNPEMPPLKSWFTQAGQQHDHNYYMKLLNSPFYKDYKCAGSAENLI